MNSVLLLLALPVAALDMEAAQANFDTVMRNYVALRADAEDVWSVKQKGATKPLKLRYEKLEEATVHPATGGLWRGLVDFKTLDGKKRYFAEALVSTGGDLWDVKSLRWLGKEQAMDLRASFISAAKAAKVAVARQPAKYGSLPDLSFPDAAGKETFLPACAKPKCLTVYVAPWCPACRNATGIIKDLQSHLTQVGVDVRVVVGADEENKVRAYASEFGNKTLLDPDKRWSVGGVPHFFVSDQDGGVHFKSAGAWAGIGPAEFASRLGLP